MTVLKHYFLEFFIIPVAYLLGISDGRTTTERAGFLYHLAYKSSGGNNAYSNNPD